MKCVLVGIAAVIGLFALAESLTCNTCSVGLVGICFNPSTTTCSTNESVCATSKATFPSISGFLGFSSLSCLESSQCNANDTTSGTILGATYTVRRTCCSTDKCNTMQTSAAPCVRFSLGAAVSAALLACVWGRAVG